MNTKETITLTKTTPMSGEALCDEIVVPRRLGSVTLTRELGRGGMGVVWLARDEMLDRDVAVKFMLSAVSSADDPRFATFLAGAKAAAAVRHPNLTSMLHAGLVEEHGGIPYLVMEYIDGPSASQLIGARGALPLGAALAVIEGACLATAELHAKEIVHRDLKPGNIMLSTRGEIFVTDFGLALARRTGAGAGDAAKVSVAGSPSYMAPEMFSGEVSAKTDVYALGVTLHELLTGDVPFAGTFEDLQRLHQHAALPKEALEAKKVPGELIEVIERAMHKNALFRYRSAEHLRGAIRAACARPDQWSRGAIELASMIGGSAVIEAAPTGAAGGVTPSATYYDAIGSRAAQRRQAVASTRDEIDAERRQAEERRREEERRVSEAIQKRREGAKGAKSEEGSGSALRIEGPGGEAAGTAGAAGGGGAPGLMSGRAAPIASGDQMIGACEECGYPLSGAAGGEAVCPECGTRCEASRVWKPGVRPSVGKIAVAMCGPMLLASVGALAAMAVPGVRGAGMVMFSGIWVVVIGLLGVGTPVFVAGRLVGACVPRRERRGAARRMWAMGVLANVLIGMVALVCVTLLMG